MFNPYLLWPTTQSHIRKATDGVPERTASSKLIALNAALLRNKSMVIKLYTVPTCKNCLFVKQFLDKEGLEYTEINCDKNVALALAVTQRAGSEELPILQYDEDNFILGYDVENLNKLIKIV